MAKQPRKEVTSLRLEPKIKYLAEIASRVQRRNLTNYIEWVIEESLKNIDICTNKTISDVSNNLWDIDESSRFIKLAILFPELLTYDEQILWKFINKFPAIIWYDLNKPKLLNNIDFGSLETNWNYFKKACSGDEKSMVTLKNAEELNMLPF